MSKLIGCSNCIGVWQKPSQYDHCPICKIQCFVHMTRTQAVHHISDCLTSVINEIDKERIS
jgi:hypothetical protein